MAELLTFWQSIREYQLPYSQEQELHQTIAQLSDYIKGLSTNSPEKYQEVMQYGKDIMCKYIDISSLSETALKALIAENGYNYITDLLELEVGHLRNIVYFLPVIQTLKGTIPGLTILLSCFSDKVVVTEWWEDETKQMPRYTFDLTVLRIKNMKLPKELPQRIYEFSSQYVYPLLGNLEIQITYSDSESNKVFATCDYTTEIIALPDINPFWVVLKTAVQDTIGATFVGATEFTNNPYTQIWTYEKVKEDIKYTLDFTCIVNFNATRDPDRQGGPSDYDTCDLLITGGGSEHLHWYWGADAPVSDAIVYRGQLTQETLIQEKEALVLAVKSLGI